MKLGVLSRSADLAFNESVNCARHINLYRQKQKLVLCLSGGIDSEAMLQAFRAAQVEFEIVFMRFAGGLNDFDIQTNQQICTELGLPYKVLEADIIKFFEDEKHLDYGLKYRCQSPQLAAHLWMIDQIDGLPILAGNPFLQTEVNGHPFFIGLPGDLHCVYFRYFKLNKRAGVPWFFIYSPELCASFLRLPTPRRLHALKIKPNEYTYLHKCQTYQEAGFSVQPRADKWTGFEEIRRIYDAKMGTTHGTGFDRLYRSPLERLNPFPTFYQQLVPRDYFL